MSLASRRNPKSSPGFSECKGSAERGGVHLAGFDAALARWGRGETRHGLEARGTWAASSPRQRWVGRLACLVLWSSAAGLAAGCTQSAASRPSGEVRERAREPDVPYEPSPALVVERMLELANVQARDVVYDLGCGDGRIVIAAAAARGARGVCVDIDPERISESRANARRAGVEERITFVTGDLFEADLEGATVVMLFFWPEVNLRLEPKLRKELGAGARVVSHYHDMGEWTPDEVVHVEHAGRSRPIYLWRIREEAKRAAPAASGVAR